MDKGLSTKRIPTLLALFILLSGVGVTLGLVNQRTFSIGQASVDISPQNIKISNLTDNSFNVSFITSQKTKALVLLEKDGTTNLILDDRDKKTGQQVEYYAHFITVPNLNPNTKYLFKLLINGIEHQLNELEATTGPVINKTPPNQNPISGSVKLPDGNDSSDSIIIAKTINSQLISTISGSHGNFSIQTNFLRTENLNNFIKLKDMDVFEIEIYNQNFSSKISASKNNSNELPTVLLGEKYEFLENDANNSSNSSILDINNSNSLDKFSELNE